MEAHGVIGRYALFDAIAAGGMATVYYGRLLGPVGFTRTVAIKQLHPRFSRDPDFVSMFIDEARVTARIRHANVVPVLDVVKHDRELYIVMEYVLGVSFAWLLRKARDRGDRVPIDVVVGIVCGCLEGLHAAHETRDEKGELLGIIHRDVSPGNVLVGRDGTARVLDFGIAKAVGRAQVTRTGEVKGKPGYMAPEQLRGGSVTRTTDIHAVAVTLWEALVGTRAFAGPPLDVVRQRQHGKGIPTASELDPELAPFDALLGRGLAPKPDDRWPTARAMADALRALQPPAGADAIASFIEQQAGTVLDGRGRIAASLEATGSPTEIRAAIQADWNAETPMFVAARDGDGSSDARRTPTGRADQGGAQDEADSRDVDLQRDGTPTRVEASSPRPAAPFPPTPARSPTDGGDEPPTEEHIAAVRDLVTPALPFEAAVVPKSGRETATVARRAGAEPDEDDSATWPAGGTTPPWQDESRRFARYGAERRSVWVGAIVVAAIALALVAMVFIFAREPMPVDAEPAGSGGESRPSLPAAAPPEAPEPLEATASRTRSTPSATGDPTTAAASPIADERPRPATSRPAVITPEKRPSSTDDPFDALGGRH